MDDRDLVLDGNALAGLLGEVFCGEPTVIRGTCGTCHAVAEVGAAVVYAQAPSPVVRCRSCGAVLLVIVRRDDRIRICFERLASLEV